MNGEQRATTIYTRALVHHSSIQCSVQLENGEILPQTQTLHPLRIINSDVHAREKTRVYTKCDVQALSHIRTQARSFVHTYTKSMLVDEYYCRAIFYLVHCLKLTLPMYMRMERERPHCRTIESKSISGRCCASARQFEPNTYAQRRYSCYLISSVSVFHAENTFTLDLHIVFISILFQFVSFKFQSIFMHEYNNIRMKTYEHAPAHSNSQAHWMHTPTMYFIIAALRRENMKCARCVAICKYNATLVIHIFIILKLKWYAVMLML